MHDKHLLERCTVRASQHRYKEINSLAYITTNLAAVEPIVKEIPAVEITMPEQDWQEIVKIIQCWQPTQCHPAVREAWDQYVMLTHLTKKI